MQATAHNSVSGKRVAIVLYRPLEDLPPVMSLLATLASAGVYVVYLGVESSATRKFLENQGIPHRLIAYQLPKLGKGRFSRELGRVCRAVTFYKRRKWVVSQLMALGDTRSDSDWVLWCAEVQAAAWIGNALFAFTNRIVSIYELGEVYGARWLGFDFKRFLNSTRIVVPELNRAFIFQHYHGLKNRPWVIPNKPYDYDDTDSPEVEEMIVPLLNSVGKSPLILYQGVLGDDRADIYFVIETICKHRPGYAVLVMPSNAKIESMKARYANLFTLPRIASPFHLQVARYASVGLAMYNASGTTLLGRLNAVYCAPNKIYEYTRCGIPVLANRIPGLIYTIEASGAGRCCEVNEAEVLDAIDDLVRNREVYRKRALKFFNSLDLNSVVMSILSDARAQ